MAQFLRRPLTCLTQVFAVFACGGLAGACQALETESPAVIDSDAGGAGSGGGGVNAQPGGASGGNAQPGGASGGNAQPGGASGGYAQPGGDANTGGVLPPPPPNCETLAVTARIEAAESISRSDAVEILYTAPAGTTISAFAAEGGLFTQRRDGALFYSPGGSVNGDDELQWPWFTGAVNITVRAVDAEGCRGEAETSVVVAGDVLASDLTSGGIFALGSDGRVIGRYRQGGNRGASDLILLPEAVGGGFVYATPGYADEPPTLTRLTAEGRRDPAVFQMETNARTPLYEDGEGPKRLIFDTERQELLGDNGYAGSVHRWSLDGSYVGHWDAPAEEGRSPAYYRTLGFARLPDGRIVFGVQDAPELYTLDNGRVDLFTQFEIGLTCLGAGADGSVVASGHDGSTVLFVRLDADAAELGRAEVSRDYEAVNLIPFRSGYLHSEASSYTLRFHTGDLQVPENQDDYWAQDYMNRNGLDNARAILWLDRNGP